METVIFSVIPETHIFFQYRHNHFSFQIHFDQHLPSIAKSAENSEYHKQDISKGISTLSILDYFFLYSFRVLIQNSGRDIVGAFIYKESLKALRDCFSYVVVSTLWIRVQSNGFHIRQCLYFIMRYIPQINISKYVN